VIKDKSTENYCQGVTSRCVNGIAPSGIRKFFDLVSTMEGAISLGVGEPDYVTPWHIRESAIYAIEKGYTMYTSNSGTPELREAVSRHLASRYSVKYDPAKELLITVGVSEALDLAMRAVLDPGDEVIMPDPCYVSYSPCVAMAGGKPVMVPTFLAQGFEMTASDIEPWITPRTKAIMLGYPANPTGATLSRAQLLEIAELARRHRLLVISDEIYDRLVYGGEHTCFSSLPGMKENCVVLGGFSKSYAMTGWRVGYAAANSEIIGAMTKIHQYTLLCAPIQAQMAATEALKFGEQSVQEMVADYNRRRLLMVRGFNRIGLECHEPKGAFYCFPSIKSTGLTSEEFSEKLLRAQKVVVVPGTAFGKLGEGHVRACYATAMSDIEEALSRIKRFLSS
jgi:aminotransferase